jgi:LysR family glycine cleavage system transcriptional activator
MAADFRIGRGRGRGASGGICAARQGCARDARG